MAPRSPRRGACWGPGGCGEGFGHADACTGIVGCGTARSFALGKAVIGEGRAAPEGAMVPQRRWRPML